MDRSRLARAAGAALLVSATSACATFVWGDAKHVSAYQAYRGTHVCEGDVTGDVKTHFYCQPKFILKNERGQKPARGALAVGGWMGLFDANDLDPAGNVRTIILLIGDAEQDFKVGAYTTAKQSASGKRAQIGGALEVRDANGRVYSACGWPDVLLQSNPRCADPAPDFLANLVLDDIGEGHIQGTLDATLVEATNAGPGAGRARVHVTF